LPHDRANRCRRWKRFTFQGYRNADGSAGSRNILGITTTVQCVSGVVEFAVRRIKAELFLSDRSANTTPGNKTDGLSNIVEKAMGSIVKSGSAPISGVVAPGERARQKGLLFAATPASDFICGTLQLAAGINLHVFTGRGTPYGLAEVPVIKVATRSDLARRWHDLMDLDAGGIATGQATIGQVGWDLFRLMLDVASGKKTWAEHWRLQNSLALFNPGPVT
jgi:galactarate dehydratase